MTELIDAIIQAQWAWDRCNWTHSRPDSGEDPVYCDGGIDNGCRYCAEVVESAARAQAYGDAAIAALKTGRLADAVEAVREASDTERTWGDDPVWGPVLRQFEAAV